METEVKKSRFITWAWPITNPEDALSKISSQRDPSASHNCFAFKIGQHYRSSDDGEPGGTAGRPILSAIENEGLDGVAVLVIRYYGGIKLGTGGLVRGYGNAARACLREAPRHEVIPRVTVVAIVPFDCMGVAYQAADHIGAGRLSEEYDVSGVVLKLQVDSDKAERLCESLKDVSAGKVEASVEK
jgi:putative IMPACT (imprinted ancient) family translation regulator